MDYSLCSDFKSNKMLFVTNEVIYYYFCYISLIILECLKFCLNKVRIYIYIYSLNLYLAALGLHCSYGLSLVAGGG